MTGVWGHCYCPSIAVIGNSFECKECHDLMPSCRSCEYSDSKQDWQLGKWVGWDDKISAHGVQFIDTNRNEKPEYVVCNQGDGVSAINIMVNRT